MPSGAVSECHDGSDVDGVNRRQHVLSGNRPPTVTANPPIFDVPNNKSVTDKHFGKRPPEFQPIPLMPKTTVDDDNRTLGSTVRNVKLTKLTGVITVSNPLHTQTLRENRPNAEGLRGSGAQPRLGVWGLGPQKTPFWASSEGAPAPSSLAQTKRGASRSEAWGSLRHEAPTPDRGGRCPASPLVRRA